MFHIGLPGDQRSPIGCFGIKASHCFCAVHATLALGSPSFFKPCSGGFGPADQEEITDYPPGFASCVIAGILFLCGPIPKMYYWPNNWTNHAVFQNYPGTLIGKDRVRVALLKISSFYKNLEKLGAGSQVIVEAPWIFGWGLNPYPFYQAVHRQHTYVGFVKDICGKGSEYFELPKDHPGLRFQNYVHISDDALLKERDVRFIILHNNLPIEIAHFLLEINIDPVYGTPSSSVMDINVIQKKILLLMGEPPDLEPLITLCQARYGPPVFEDRDLVVFERKKEG